MQDSEKSIKIDDVVNHSIEESDQSSSICMQKFKAATNSNESNKHSFGPYEEQKGESLKMDTSDNQTTNKQLRGDSENASFYQNDNRNKQSFLIKKRILWENWTGLNPNGKIDPKSARPASQMYPLPNSNIVGQNMQPNRRLHNAFSYPLEESKSFDKNSISSAKSSNKPTLSQNALKHKLFKNATNPKMELSAINRQIKIKDVLPKMGKILNTSKNGNNKTFYYNLDVSNSESIFNSDRRFNYSSAKDLRGAAKKAKKPKTMTKSKKPVKNFTGLNDCI